ncbi:MAG: hypothetical protein ACRDJH_04600 [Thermomicrobiales bacterium]
MLQNPSAVASSGAAVIWPLVREEIRQVVEPLVPNDKGADGQPPEGVPMIRHADVTGISGVGRALDGVVFADSQTVVRWCVAGKSLSTEIYATFAEFVFIHVDSHPANATETVLLNRDPPN